MPQDHDATAQSAASFLSYSRDDDAVMNGIADEIKLRIEGLYRAKTGKNLKIFVDRQDIGWGEDWRVSIADAVRGATAFIPLVTMNYFNRAACREELMAFYASAKVLGVTDLILPLILAGGRLIDSSDPREEVRIVERLQHESLEEVWPHGFKSPEWAVSMNRITDKLIVALEKAENKIAELEVVSSEQRASYVNASFSRPSNAPEVTSGAGIEFDESEDVEGGLYYLVHEFQEECEEFGKVAPGALLDVQEFLNVVMVGIEKLNSSTSRQEVSRNSILVANEVLGLSQRLGESGAAMLQHLSTADAALRQVVFEVGETKAPGVSASLREALQEVRSLTDGMENLPERLDEMVEMLAFVQRMSVSLRRAFAPGHNGIMAIRDSVKIFRSWDELAKTF
ncbi:toll/interleukin-1 receptor domain-containing protein [Dactylosporangium sp. NPDC050688]|uniref:toll/interleukin-1 receptor domain-containing protein n=1 Tax=Dactylosporangium sp. NPDC050688 TaxID=3157217 RepID=UPI0033E54816